MNNKITFPKKGTKQPKDYAQRGKIGSNQYRKKHKAGWRAYLAVITFIGIVAWVLTMPLYAAEKSNGAPVTKVSSDTITQQNTDSEREDIDKKFERIEAFMQTQLKMNKFEAEWRNAQGIINLKIVNEE